MSDPKSLSEASKRIIERLSAPSTVRVSDVTCKCSRGPLYEVNGELQETCPDCQVEAEIAAEQERIANRTIGLPIYKDVEFVTLRNVTDRHGVTIEECKQYSETLEKGEGRNLVFVGNQGTGKTLLADLMLRTLHKRGFSTKYKTAKQIYTEYEDWRKSDISTKQFFNDMLKLDILCIDEIGRQSLSKPEKDFFFELIDMFIRNRKSLILISNLDVTGQDKEKLYFTDIVDLDRIRDERIWKIYPFDWSSLR